MNLYEMNFVLVTIKLKNSMLSIFSLVYIYIYIYIYIYVCVCVCVGVCVCYNL